MLDIAIHLVQFVDSMLQVAQLESHREQSGFVESVAF